MNNKTWQKVLAVPATLSIGLGGALLAVAPAHAVVTDDTVNASVVAPTDTPTDASTDAPVATETPAPVDDAAVAPTPAPTEAAPVPTSTPAPSDAAEVPADEPAPIAILPTPVVTTPTAGATLQGPKITLTGTGTPGNYVLPIALSPEEYEALAGPSTPPTARAAAPAPIDQFFGGVLVAADGSWTATALVAESGTYRVGAGEYTVAADGTPTGASQLSAGVDVTVNVAPLVAPAPVVTAPTAGEVIRAKNITFTGTGTPGANIAVIVATPSYFDEYLAEQLELLNGAIQAPAGELGARALAAEPEPNDPEDPIIVDANGNWSAVLPLEIGAYRVGAIQVVNDGVRSDVSELSATVDFSVAAVLPAPVALPGTTPAGGTLPETGSDAGLIAGLGGLLVLGGGALLLARRRMTASAE